VSLRHQLTWVEIKRTVEIHLLVINEHIIFFIWAEAVFIEILEA
jgi:hypothetical protein